MGEICSWYSVQHEDVVRVICLSETHLSEVMELELEEHLAVGLRPRFMVKVGPRDWIIRRLPARVTCSR
jgi:hypothetical protein